VVEVQGQESQKEGDLHRKSGTVWFLWKEGVKPSPVVS